MCSIPPELIFNGGVAKDGIPALTNAPLVLPHSEEAAYLRPEDRVIGVVVEEQAIAVPHNILWWHEITNIQVPGGPAIAVTFCPLTGSSLAFDRGAVGNAEFGVSGLLYQNNLIMYDRRDDESLWVQMLRGARCGVANGSVLQMYPVLETTWAGWQELHPGTRVIGAQTGVPRDYTWYPYGDHEQLDNPRTLFPTTHRMDSRRPPKERVLGIATGNGEIVFPFLELDSDGTNRVVPSQAMGAPMVVLWDSQKQAAMAFRPEVDGHAVTLQVAGGAFTDRETGSQWSVDGRATTGPLAGRRLPPVPEAFVAFWFAWVEFYGSARIWEAPDST